MRLVSFLLQSCIVETAFVAGAATGASIINDKRSMHTIIEDKNMSHQINNKIEADDELYQQCHIVISTYNHIVLLTGQAPTDELRKQALATVKTQDKIKRIYNEIQIAAPSSALTVLVMLGSPQKQVCRAAPDALRPS